LESLMPQDGKLVAQDGKLVAQDRGLVSRPLARASVQNVKAAGGALALESSLFRRFLNENPRALFYLLKPFASNTDGPALVTIGSPDLIGTIIEALRKKGVVDPSEVEALAMVIKALEAGTLRKVELLKPGETEASIFNKLTASNQGGIATLHLDGAMLPDLKDGVHFAFEEKIGSEDLMVATVLGIALKSMADLIRNIPDVKVRGELLSKFVAENLPGVRGNGTNFIISQIAQLAQAFVQQALIAKSA